MPSDRLYELLANALAKPSKAYQAAEAGLAIPQQALEGYLSGTDISDKLRQRKLAQSTLSDALGGNVPERVRSYGGLTLPTVEKLGGLKGLADITEPVKTPEHNDTLENILAENVRSGKMTLEQAGTIKRNMSPGSFVKPEPGFRFDESGNLVPIPGGTPSRKIADEEAAKTAARASATESARNVISKIDEGLSNVGPTTTGFGGSIMRHVAGSRARDLQNTLNSVRANLTFDSLAKMKADSPRGSSGLGALSDTEGKLLSDARAAVDQEQSDDQLVSNLKDVRKHYSNVALINESQTGDPEADGAIAKVISSDASEQEKRARIQGIRSAAGR